MGGTVGITIRRADGREHRMQATTGWIPHFFTNMKFLDGDEAHLEELISESDQNKGLAPENYGLIVVDYQTKTILEQNGYSRIGHLDSAGAWNANHRDPKEFERYKRLFDAKRVREVLMGKKSRKPHYQWEDATDLSIEVFMDNADPEANPHTARVDMSPWTIKYFGDIDDTEGSIRMLKEVKEMGFALTAKEEKLWENFIMEHQCDPD